MKRTVLKVIKIGRQEHMDNFLRVGEMYIDTVEAFIKKDSNQERFDDHEGAEVVIQVNWLKLQAKSGKTKEFSKTVPNLIQLASAYVLTHTDIKKGNIYCCSAVTPDTIESFKKLDARFLEFGDTIVLIENPKIFFERVEQELKRKKYAYEIGLVHYYDPKKEERTLSIFNKKNSLSYQNEISIWVKNESSKSIKIYIGPITDIALKYRMHDITRLQKEES